MAPALARQDQAFSWLGDDPHPGDGAGDGRGVIGARIVDEQNLVRATRLRQERVQARRHIGRFVVGTDDDGDSQGGDVGRGHRGEPNGRP